MASRCDGCGCTSGDDIEISECPTCGRPTCPDCLFECSVCGKPICKNCSPDDATCEDCYPDTPSGKRYAELLARTKNNGKTALSGKRMKLPKAAKETMDSMADPLLDPMKVVMDNGKILKKCTKHDLQILGSKLRAILGKWLKMKSDDVDYQKAAVIKIVEYVLTNSHTPRY